MEKNPFITLAGQYQTRDGRLFKTQQQARAHAEKLTIWSVLIYMAADNDLTAEAVADLDAISRPGAQADTHVAVELDTLGKQGSLRYEITQPDTLNQGRGYRKVIERLPEQPSGDPMTLRNFLAWGIGRRLDAEHRLVIIWGHGSGRQVAPDETSFGSALDIPELNDALAQAGFGAPETSLLWSPHGRQEPVSVLLFDAWLMSMLETAREFCDQAQFLVASQELVPRAGLPYDLLLRDLQNHGMQRPPERVAKRIIKRYIEYYRQQQVNATLAVIELTKIPLLIDALQALGETLVKSIQANDGQQTSDALDSIRRVRIFARSFFLPDCVDLVDLAERFAEVFGGTSKVGKAAKQLIRATIASVRLVEGTNQRVGINGLSIWFPATRALYLSHRHQYLRLRFNRETGTTNHGWVNFLDTYYRQRE